VEGLACEGLGDVASLGGVSLDDDQAGVVVLHGQPAAVAGPPDLADVLPIEDAAP
jgi:hypothetical protein